MSVLTEASVMTFVATARPAEARAFYEGVLGLTFVEDSPFALVFDLHGTMLRIQKVHQVVATTYTALGWQVADIRATVKELTGAGVTFERYEGMPQDELGIWATLDGSAVAWFKDPDGNTLSLAQLASGEVEVTPAGSAERQP
jgi:catechol 2,3-dioxygenase-like lactoylglutathione lyase family enzyme